MFNKLVPYLKWLFTVSLFIQTLSAFGDSPDGWFESPLPPEDRPGRVPGEPPQKQNISFLSRLMHPKIPIQVGGFLSYNGVAQHVAIRGLVGDDFSVTTHTDGNVILGAGYYIDGQDSCRLLLRYGINAFYLPTTTVKGTVTQEEMFTNLSYTYSTTNIPIFVAAKGFIKNKYNDRYYITFDLGVGGNILSTSSISETSLDTITLPDRIYSGATDTVLSAMAGVGFQVNHIMNERPIECGYRFLYLGRGNFRKEAVTLLSKFQSGNGYANALMCSMTFSL